MTNDAEEELTGMLLMKKIAYRHQDGEINQSKSDSTPDIDLRLVDEKEEVPIHEDHYYALKPLKTKIYNLLVDVKHYRVILKDLNEEIAKRDLIAEFPAQFSQVRVIIEFFDCIIEAKSLNEFKEISDDIQKEKKM